MAVTPVNALQARQKARMSTRNAGVFYTLKSFFLHLAANKQNPDLLYTPIDGNVNASDGDNTADQVLANAACKLYVLYLKKSGSTATWFKATDHATTAATNGTQDISLKITTSGEERVSFYPDGYAFANGITVTEDTTATGSTLTLAANKVDGFVIVGAP